MKAAFFLGCSIPVRAQNYEIATRKVADALGLELVDLPGTGCCGYPLRSISGDRALAVAADALAQVEETGNRLVTICSACTGTLTEAAHRLAEDVDARERVNRELEKSGRSYSGTVQVRHFARFLLEDVGEEAIRERIRVDLSELRFASHYGCHFLKPGDAYEGFDSTENPRSLDRLVRIAGAQTVEYVGKKRCCGGACLAVDEGLALRITKDKLDAIRAREADGIVLVCPFCSIMYDSNQKKIEGEYQVEYGIPVLYYPQLLGLAMGIDPKELGFQMNRVKAKDLLARIPAPASA